MLPIVQLKYVTRNDVQRIANWLLDEDVSSRWFGHYACGDPVHRGYEPVLMLNASSEDWARVFDRDRRRLIYSIYANDEGHIGECQAVFDGSGDVELSLLIGRKDLWHRGYGAAAAFQLLDRVFYDYPVERAWVSVPRDNIAALRLFGRLGFSLISGSAKCLSPGGDVLESETLALRVEEYRDGKIPAKSASAKTAVPLVTVTGLPGSGSEHVGAEAARLLRAKFVDRQLTADIASRLDRTAGEIEALEASYTSIWARLLRAALEPWERFGAVDYSPEFMGTWPGAYQIDPSEYLTKEEYLDGLRDVVAAKAASGLTVVHGHGAVSVPLGRIPAFHVFVEMNSEGRERKAQLERKTFADAAAREMRQADKIFISQYRGLYGVNPLDPNLYDITISMNRLTVEDAARIVSNAVGRSVRSRQTAMSPSTNGFAAASARIG